MLAVIGAVIQIALILLKVWSDSDKEKKKQMNDILKEVPSAKTPESITRIFDRINRL